MLLQMVRVHSVLTSDYICGHRISSAVCKLNLQNIYSDSAGQLVGRLAGKQEIKKAVQ